MVAFPITLGRDDLDGTLDDTPHLRQGLLNQAFDLGKRLGRLHPVVAYPLETFRKHMLNLCGEVNYVARMTQMTILP